MLIFDLDKPIPIDELTNAAGSLHALAHDFTRVAGGAFPTDADLADAPLLDHFTIELAVAPVLTGAVTGHPTLKGNGRLITTSQLHLLALREGWARTQSRFYRLGRQANAPRPQA
ncbi:DUF6634 family protein [Oryzibacter oryziterrae]|uniref:DUF6634 family protein n=1 Tax=Oryzibacter oryziterrae TaxID=2766474 RepID=UPI001F279F34|nr:DUF6634 family protein [Oryzibacter oryziterrae]